MPALLANRIGWFIRRLSRISPAEVPYRVGGALRMAAQGCGWFDVARPPAIADDATFGRPWVRVPQASFVDSQSVMEAADRILREGVAVYDISVFLHNGVPEWNRDPKTGAEIERKFGLYIDFRHLRGGVDIKYLWELTGKRFFWMVRLTHSAMR